MAQQSSPTPSTPVKVSSSAANYSAATMEPDLRSQVNDALLRDGHITRIHEALLHALHSDPSNWPTAIQSRALSLMRSGQAPTFPKLLQRVIQEVRESTKPPPPSATATAATASASNNSSSSSNSVALNGETKTANGGGGNTPAPELCLALPESVVEEALRVTMECLDAICEMECPES
ncbi:hypothetical protein L249_1479 [Ophiocordyceps polyrhachis-furcata BCC 54312]|uniref:Uncharacterized protein n=1 Tax=Ophiocordyceps polyrhachis-furcata BCC 54312 TaxID=1330021 RepID=A0A367L4Z7_9HYPO|nr:hypothetical protein L249_1479 [Ophiocordyceps polyrhachis-furcata BCC 54312]